MYLSCSVHLNSDYNGRYSMQVYNSVNKILWHGFQHIFPKKVTSYSVIGSYFKYHEGAI